MVSGNFLEIRHAGGPVIKSSAVKRQINLMFFAVDLQGNNPTIMVHPSVEYLYIKT